MKINFHFSLTHNYKILILIPFFYLLTLFQNSFLSRFSIFGVSPNLILILVCLLSFFEGPYKYSNVFLALAAGFFLDIFSNSFFGISVFSFTIIYFLIKETIHILRDISQKYSISYFIPIFIFCIILYDFFFGLFSYFFNHSTLSFLEGYILLIKVVYNLFFAIVGFYLLNPPKFLLRKNFGGLKNIQH